MLSYRVRQGSPVAVAALAAVVCAVLVAGCVPTTPVPTTSTTSPPASTRIDLRVLVISAADPGTDAVKVALDLHGVPYTEVALGTEGRPVVTESFLADTVGGARRSKFQSIVTPDVAPAGLSAAEAAAIASVEQEFRLRHVDAYVYPSAASGLNPPAYSGTLDGMVATVAPAARAAEWSALRGTVPFDDVDPSVNETHGYLATPLPDDPQAGRSFEPLVTMPVPGTGNAASVIGVHRVDGRERLVITSSMNGYQTQLLALADGIVNWMTRGIHLGSKRNFFTVHADDVFLPDERWSVADNCTPGEDCPPGVSTTPIRMSAADVQVLRSWQETNNFLIDLVFNGGGYDAQVAETGSDAMGDALLSNRQDFRWVNHTLTHEYLGCEKNFSVLPWQCTTSDGQVVWAPASLIAQQVDANVAWAVAKGIPFDPRELVTGEHSGLRRAPEEPSDNPFFADVLTDSGIQFLAADASREFDQRRIGTSGPLTLPRYPMNVFFNVATEAEQIDEYNWIYNSTTDGGSGICETDPRSTCIEPLHPNNGFDDYIAPLEARLALLRVLNGWPLPHYVHQSNLAEERIAYPVVEQVLEDYRSLFVDGAPAVNPPMSAATDLVSALTDWRAERASGTDDVVAHVQDGVVHVAATRSLRVPLTVPVGSQVAGTDFGDAYGGRRTGWTPITPAAPLQVAVPTGG